MEGRGYEKLVALYLRLNGYFIVENFIVHPQNRCLSQRTEVDVFGVRLPYQAEKPGKTIMPNDPKLVQPSHNCVDVVFAEVKSRRRPRPNKSWRNEGVLEYVLRFVGFTPEDEELSIVAESLRKDGNAKSHDNKFCFKIVVFSCRQARSSNVRTITLDHVLRWIVDERFKHWAQVKTQREQWDATTLQRYLLDALSLHTRFIPEDIKNWGQKMTEAAQSALMTLKGGEKK
ncbi:MAG: hypothetical protein WBC82_12130 [Dehalococcoidia bacterium]